MNLAWLWVVLWRVSSLDLKFYTCSVLFLSLRSLTKLLYIYKAVSVCSVSVCVCVTSFDHFWLKHLNAPSQCSDTEISRLILPSNNRPKTVLKTQEDIAIAMLWFSLSIKGCVRLSVCLCGTSFQVIRIKHWNTPSQGRGSHKKSQTSALLMLWFSYKINWTTPSRSLV